MKDTSPLVDVVLHKFLFCFVYNQFIFCSFDDYLSSLFSCC